ncbi:LuxR family transcriptional regulator [Actinomadura darangshiensis]|uniref:LuxR family transcriptional regulator n=1 Tax=Actinomadura darangshiensis TaxID=705336 RepID=A0A4R5ALL3_9ACTN|nr:helix-turn-helix transcriptional regulator [Actinomadura darangshiensis]TDD73818.1 LuxR family transcriptional regulator [Actinomadura darangshiensis]
MHLSAHDQERLAAVLATARHEVLSLVPTWPAALRDDHPHRRAAPTTRLVVSRHCGGQTTLQPGHAQIRLGGDFTTFLLVVDRKTALVRRNGPYIAPTIVQAAEVDRLVTVFTDHWDRSVPLTPFASRPMTELQLDIIRRLATGMTDQAAANALQISSRTVQRQVRDVMEQFGARSRLELGICLAAKDLV